MSYRVTFQRDTDSGWWLARVPSVAGCHTQGRTVGEARRRIREALGLFVDDAAAAEFQETVKMPAAVRQAVRAYRLLRKRAEGVKASRAATRLVLIGSVTTRTVNPSAARSKSCTCGERLIPPGSSRVS